MLAQSQNIAHITSNLLFILLLAGSALAIWLGHGRPSPDWIRLLLGGVVIGLILNLYATRSSHCAIERQTKRLEQYPNAYRFGYWSSAAAILAAILASKLGVIRAETALPLLAITLIAPTAYRALASLRG